MNKLSTHRKPSVAKSFAKNYRCNRNDVISFMNGVMADSDIKTFIAYESDNHIFCMKECSISSEEYATATAYVIFVNEEECPIIDIGIGEITESIETYNYLLEKRRIETGIFVLYTNEAINALNDGKISRYSDEYMNDVCWMYKMCRIMQSSKESDIKDEGDKYVTLGTEPYEKLPLNDIYNYYKRYFVNNGLLELMNSMLSDKEMPSFTNVYMIGKPSPSSKRIITFKVDEFEKYLFEEEFQKDYICNNKIRLKVNDSSLSEHPRLNETYISIDDFILHCAISKKLREYNKKDDILILSNSTMLYMHNHGIPAAGTGNSYKFSVYYLKDIKDVYDSIILSYNNALREKVNRYKEQISRLIENNPNSVLIEISFPSCDNNYWSEAILSFDEIEAVTFIPTLETVTLNYESDGNIYTIEDDHNTHLLLLLHSEKWSTTSVNKSELYLR